MKKLIRYAIAAFATWAIVTYAWAAFSHVTGFVGPAQASASSLEFVADAVEFLDPPGAFGAPQRFAAVQIRNAARTAERVHGNAENNMAAFVDRLGHAQAHRVDRRRHKHRHGRGGNYDDIVIRLDDYGEARDHARRMAVIEIDRHRELLDRERVRVDRVRERAQERARRGVERALERSRRHIYERGQSDFDFKFDFRLGDEDLRFIREFEGHDGQDQILDGQLDLLNGEAMVIDVESMIAELERGLERAGTDLEASLDKEKLKERIEKLLDMLEKQLEFDR